MNLTKKFRNERNFVGADAKRSTPDGLGEKKASLLQGFVGAEGLEPPTPSV